MYSGQWLAVVGFLPTVYAEAGVQGSVAGALTALVAAANMAGNIASGWLLHRGVPPRRLLYTGYLTMGLSTLVAYGVVGGLHAGPTLHLLCVVSFSAVGGLIPGTLFALAVRVAPSPYTVSTTVGWTQQLSALGQLCGPPLAAWVAVRMGNWHSTWWVTVGCSIAGLLLATPLARIAAHSRPLQARA
jgi:cyanate permease